jgi:hypothetical protein
MTTFETPTPQPPVRPHPLSNDLTEEPMQISALEASADAESALPRGEKRVLGRVAMFVGAIAVVAIIVAAIMFPRPELWAIGAVFMLLYGILLISPVILADSTKVAQDETVREQLPPAEPSTAIRN